MGWEEFSMRVFLSDLIGLSNHFSFHFPFNGKRRAGDGNAYPAFEHLANHYFHQEAL